MERAAVSRRSTSDWWSLAYMAYNEPGGYQYRTVVQVLEKHVECMLDGCAGANHVTEEFLVGMLNRAAELGIRTEDPRFPVVRLEKGASRVRPGHRIRRAGALEGRSHLACHPLFFSGAPFSDLLGEQSSTSPPNQNKHWAPGCCCLCLPTAQIFEGAQQV